MGSVERRIEALERAYGGGDSEERERFLAENREQMRITLEKAGEKAAREEAAGDPRRRIALEELEARMKARVQLREGG